MALNQIERRTGSVCWSGAPGAPLRAEGLLQVILRRTTKALAQRLPGTPDPFGDSRCISRPHDLGRADIPAIFKSRLRKSDDLDMWPTEMTPAALRFRFVVVGCALLLAISVFMPWCSLAGCTGACLVFTRYSYSFMTVDRWIELPIAELTIVAAGLIGVWRFPRYIKPIGKVLGIVALALNILGAFIAAADANVHNPDPYFRIRAVVSFGPSWGGVVAIFACLVLIVGGFANWTALVIPRAANGEVSDKPQDAPIRQTVEEPDVQLPPINEVLRQMNTKSRPEIKKGS